MKILVVDDERDVQALFEQKFRKEIKNKEVEFLFAFSGEEAVVYLGSHTHEAVLILSDINMPGIPRTDWQSFWRMITGLKSTDETSYNATTQITTMQEMRMKDKVDKILQHLKEHPVIGDKERQLVLQLGVEAGKDPGYVVDAIINYRMQMKMTPDQRKASKASSLEGIGKYQRYQEQRELE